MVAPRCIPISGLVLLCLIAQISFSQERMMEATEKIYRTREFRPIRPIQIENPASYQLPAPPETSFEPTIPIPPAPRSQQELVTTIPAPTPPDFSHSPTPKQNSFSGTYDPEVFQRLKEGIESQRRVGYANYDPKHAYVVDPSKQELIVVNLNSLAPVLTIPVGTGKRGLGFGGAQTPIGFFTMGGVRIAKNASAYIQTGDSKSGVSGVYAEILYPPSYHESWKRGRVPNNVIIHGFNPAASSMLRDRHQKNMIGRIPCTTGCPTPGMKDLPKLAPYLKESAGSFDPSANPNSNLRNLIRKKQVVEYSNRTRLGDPILILNRPFRG